MMMFIGLFWLVTVLLLLRWASQPSAGRTLPGGTPPLEDEVRRLRDEVDRLSGQVERLLDEQSFLLGLLEGGDRPQALEGKSTREQRAAALHRAVPPADTPDQKPTH